MSVFFDNETIIKTLNRGAFLGHKVNRLLEKYERHSAEGTLTRNGNTITFSREGKKPIVVDLDNIKSSDKHYSCSRFFKKLCCNNRYKKRLTTLVNALSNKNPPDPLLPQKAHLKSGFCNAGSTCWLATSLQFINAAPHAFAQNVDDLARKEDETAEMFDQRKRIAGLILNLLAKSRSGTQVTNNEMLNLRKELSDFHVDVLPRITERGHTRLCIQNFAYILEVPTTKFLVPSEEEYEIGFSGMPLMGVPNSPLSTVCNVEIEIEDGIPKCPFSFIGKSENAPPMIVTNNDTLNGPLTNLQDRDFKCRVPCTKDTYCDYELVAVAISVPGHFYACVKEGNGDESVWAKYNDSSVSVYSTWELLKQDVARGHCFLYRKIPQA